MGFELPVVSAVMARLRHPEIHLAAYGGIVFPLALLIEAPVIMLLAASTALSRNWDSYLCLRRFMLQLAGILTVLHILAAFTPLYDLVAVDVLGVPEQILEPGRMGLMLMTPWTASIAIRRFQQGVLIRSGWTRIIGLGTTIRLLTNMSVLFIGLAIGTLPGIVVGTAGISLGVISEAIFIHIQVQPLLKTMRTNRIQTEQVMTLNELLTFYIPLAMTPLVALSALPIGSASMSRMPNPMDSLAVWPVLMGLVFILRSVGIAYQEVVVALLEHPDGLRMLWRFAMIVGASTTSLLIIIAATPLARMWFSMIGGLSPTLTNLGSQAIWLTIFLPALGVIESVFHGILVQGKHTKGVTEGVLVYLVTYSGCVVTGAYYGQITGLYVSLGGMILGLIFQALWLWRKCLIVAQPSFTPSVPLKASPSKCSLM